MKKENKSSKLRLFLLVNCVASVLFTLFATFAWFKINNNVNNESLIKAEDVEIAFTYKFYKYEDNNGIHDLIESTDTSDLHLNPYDTIIRTRNEYNTLVIQFDVSGEKVTRSQSDLSLTIKCTEQFHDAQCISNITQYKFLLMDAEDTKEDTYYSVCDAAAEMSTNYRFVTTTVNGNTKTYTKSKTINYTISADDYTGGDDTRTSFTLFVVIDYAEDLIEEVFGDVQGASTEQDDAAGSSTRFINDLTTIEIVEYEE